jgi:hypothetical protein
MCCGTKRLVEIRCPSNCGYLASAREHPAAVVRRQQERDFAALLPTIEKLTERQQQLFFLVHSAIARHRPEGFTRLIDEDVAEAAAALAATTETAARGVIYEHAPQSRSAQRLASDIKGVLGEIRKQATTISDREVAGALRAIEQGARHTAGGSGDDSAYLTLMARLLRQHQAEEPEIVEAAKPASGLIIP